MPYNKKRLSVEAKWQVSKYKCVGKHYESMNDEKRRWNKWEENFDAIKKDKRKEKKCYRKCNRRRFFLFFLFLLSNKFNRVNYHLLVLLPSFHWPFFKVFFLLLLTLFLWTSCHVKFSRKLIFFFCLLSNARSRKKNQKLKRILFCLLLSKRVCVACLFFFYVVSDARRKGHGSTWTSFVYEELPLTSFSLGFVSLVVGFLFRKPPPPPRSFRLPRSRWAFGGGPFADVFVVVLADVVGAVDCCDEFCDCWADVFSLAFTSTDAVVLLMLLLLVVPGAALFA